VYKSGLLFFAAEPRKKFTELNLFKIDKFEGCRFGLFDTINSGILRTIFKTGEIE